jgi:putative membrane protein
MGPFLAENYDWLRAFHLIFVITWMAGLFYLPRLFVYHADVEIGADQDKLFRIMERRLLRIIMNPAMIGAWLFGLLLLWGHDWRPFLEGWFHFKFAAVIGMTGFHMFLVRWRRHFAQGRNQKGSRFYRRVNEVPTLLMVVIVLVVILKPGLGS